MAGELQPLDQQFAIVDAQGRPTLYFTKWAQQRQIDIGDSITLTDLQAYLTAHKLIPGTGIQLTPDGDINDGVTIHADVQAILDEITATRGAILYRGLLGWAALLPGAAGNFLQTAGAGADPLWAAGGGGGGALVNLASQTLAVAAATITFTGLDQTHTDLIVVLTGRGDTAATFADLVMKINNDGGANYDYQTLVANAAAPSSGGNVGQTSVLAGWVPAAAGVANAASTTEINFPDYANTVFHKDFRTAGGLRISAAAAGLFKKDIWGNWRSTAAINRVDFSLSAGNFVAGTKVTIYGRG